MSRAPVYQVKVGRIVEGIDDKGRKVRTIDPAMLKLFSGYIAPYIYVVFIRIAVRALP